MRALIFICGVMLLGGCHSIPHSEVVKNCVGRQIE